MVICREGGGGTLTETWGRDMLDGMEMNEAQAVAAVPVSWVDASLGDED